MSSRLGTIDLDLALRPFAEVDKNVFADVFRQDLQLSLLAKHRAGTFVEPLGSVTACSAPWKIPPSVLLRLPIFVIEPEEDDEAIATRQD